MKRVKLLALVAIVLMILTACGQAKQAKLPEQDKLEVIRVEAEDVQLLITHSEEMEQIYRQLAEAKKAEETSSGEAAEQPDALKLILAADDKETIFYLYTDGGKTYLNQPRVGTWLSDKDLYINLQRDLKE